MKFTTTMPRGTTILAGAALAAVLGGCLSGADQSAEDRQARANSLKFIQESSAPISAQLSADDPKPGYANPQHDAIVNNLKAIGCPKLADLFGDLIEYDGQSEFPQSFIEHLSCYGLSATPTVDEIDGIYAKFENPEELLNCICGGTGLTDYLNANGFPVSGIFEGSVEAASSSFEGSSSGASGSFEGSSDGATGSFDGSVKGGSGSFGD